METQEQITDRLDLDNLVFTYFHSEPHISLKVEEILRTRSEEYLRNYGETYIYNLKIEEVKQ